MINNRISRQHDDYLAYKHSLGFKLIHEATVLRGFSDYTLTIEYDGSFLIYKNVDCQHFFRQLF